METQKTAEEVLSKHLNDDVSKNGITLSCCTEYILNAMEEYAKQFKSPSPAIVESDADKERELQKTEFRRICTAANSINSAADECFKFAQQILAYQKNKLENFFKEYDILNEDFQKYKQEVEEISKLMPVGFYDGESLLVKITMLIRCREAFLEQIKEAEKDAVEFGQFLQESCSDVDYSDVLASPKPDTEIGKLYFHDEARIVTIKYMYQLYLSNKQKQK